MPENEPTKQVDVVITQVEIKGELSEADLEAVAGGSFLSSLEHIGSEIGSGLSSAAHTVASGVTTGANAVGNAFTHPNQKICSGFEGAGGAVAAIGAGVAVTGAGLVPGAIMGAGGGLAAAGGSLESNFG